jgi:hypothetical protein
MGWIVVIIAVIGLALNVAGKWQGFSCWVFSNVYLVLYNAKIGEPEQALMFAVFLVMSVYGLFSGPKRQKQREEYRRITRAAHMAATIIAAQTRREKGEQKVKCNPLIEDAQKILDHK